MARDFKVPITSGGVDIPTVSSTSTLTNKDLSSSTNTLPDFYPVGTQYTNSTNSANPSTYLPGQSASTWTADSGTVTVAKAASGTFATAGATGGAETHTLITAEMPAHTHTLPSNMLRYVGSGGAIGTTGGSNLEFYNVRATVSTGGDGAHNNLQPYKVKYVWNRVS